MIKRFRFATRRAGCSLRDFSVAWLSAVEPVRRAPAGAAPLRAVSCTVLGDVAGTATPHAAIGIEWFADLAALSRFEAWLEAEDDRPILDVVEPEAEFTFLAEEVVVRGADWLAQRWDSGAVKLKHMALARRAAGLSAAEFSRRWRSKAGTLGRAAIAIPDAAKGRAYVQNHPLTDGANLRGYDAVNEVYFDDLEALRARTDFFAELDVGRLEADLVSATTFVAVAERVVWNLSANWKAS